MYDRLHAQLQAKLQRLQDINNQCDKLVRPSIKESTAFTRAQRLIVSIQDSEKRAADAVAQQSVLLHMSTRCKDETACLDRELGELQATKAKLDEELREQSSSTKVGKAEPSLAWPSSQSLSSVPQFAYDVCAMVVIGFT